MKKNNKAYLLWLKKRNAKLLKKRAVKKKKQHIITYQIQKEKKYELPGIFSISENSNEVIDFFNNVISFIKKKENHGTSIFFNISNVKRITTDALMYLLAIINNVKNKSKLRIYFSGNEPVDTEARQTLIESGFYNYVRYLKKEQLEYTKDNIKIFSGQDFDVDKIKMLCDYISKIRKSKKHINFHFLYDTIGEIMLNTHYYAYNDTTILEPVWYCYSEYLDNEKVKIVFLDTGVGIPTTVRKKTIEKLIGKDDCFYLVSALMAKERSSTKLPYRGKGLPRVMKYCHTKKIEHVDIVTNKAKVSIIGDKIKKEELNCVFQGTMFSFEIRV